MIITCQECDSRFVLDDKLIKPTGSKVRCSSCKHVFKVFPETEDSSPVEPPAPSPEPAPVPPPPQAQAPRNLDEGDDLAAELDRELDRLFGPDDSPFGEPAAAEETPPPVPESAPETEAAGGPDTVEKIDLDDLSFEDFDLAESPDAVTGGIDLADLDIDFALDDEPVPAAARSGEEVDDALDFSQLEVSLTGNGEKAPLQEEEFDFSDIGLTLDETGTPDTPPASGGDSAMDALDFSELELSLDGEGAAEAPAFDDEFDFSDLGVDLEAPAGGAAMEEGGLEEEFDFSDLALSLDDGSGDVGLVGDDEEISLSLDEGEVEAVSLGGSGELDLSLDDDLFDTAPAVSAERGLPNDDEGFMALDLDLDEEEPMQVALESALDEELDLSELESLLMEEPTADEPGPEEEDIELELDLDYQTEEMAPLPTEGLDESDFSDIEAMLEKDEAPVDVAFDLAPDMDLDLDLELDLELAPEEEVAFAPQAMKAASMASMVERTEIVHDAQPPKPKAAPREKASKTIAPAAGRGSGLRILFTILFVVVLLFAILVGVYSMKDEIRDRTGIAIPTIAAVEQAREQVAGLGIPGVSDWLKPEVKDPSGNLKLVTQDVVGRFVTSPSLGDLFLITGKVKNNYETTRHSISLTGRLFSKDNREVQGKEFFAGNMMTDEELTTFTMEQVEQRLKTAMGQENINARVRPGQLVPFMVVFEKLPDDLAEFAVEVRESREGAAIQ